MAKPKVLVTGAAGLIGAALWDHLRDRWDLVGVDKAAAPGGWSVEGDIRDSAQLEALAAGCDAVVHLAADLGYEPGWDRIVPHNIEGTIAVFEAARRAGVPHVVFASSNHVTGGYEHDDPYRRVLRGDHDGLEPGGFAYIAPTDPPNPDGPYGVSKVFGEALGRLHSAQHGMRVQCLRIGSCLLDDTPLDARHQSTFISQRDVALLVEACLRSTVQFGVYYGVSDNRWRIWDLDAARADLGWTPVDSAERVRSVAGRTQPVAYLAPPRKLHPVAARAGRVARAGRRRVVKALRVLRSG